MKSKSIRYTLHLIVLEILILFSPVWSRNPGGFWNILFGLAIFVLVIMLLVRLIKEIVFIIKRWKQLNKKSLLPLSILVLGSVIVFFSPDIEDKLYGKITFRACYEGTQNHATFFLRTPDRFEFHHTAVFFYDKYYRGTYERKEDTLFLKYFGLKQKHYQDTVLMDYDTEFLKPIKNDSVVESRLNFYFGYCRGEN